MSPPSDGGGKPRLCGFRATGKALPRSAGYGPLAEVDGRRAHNTERQAHAPRGPRSRSGTAQSAVPGAHTAASAAWETERAQDWAAYEEALRELMRAVRRESRRAA
jgi:hypothetical protein